MDHLHDWKKETAVPSRKKKKRGRRSAGSLKKKESKKAAKQRRTHLEKRKQKSVLLCILGGKKRAQLLEDAVLEDREGQGASELLGDAPKKEKKISYSELQEKKVRETI